MIEAEVGMVVVAALHLLTLWPNNIFAQLITLCLQIEQEKMSTASADMICGRPSSCQVSQTPTANNWVRPSLQSAPEPPSVCKHVRQICGNCLRFLTSGDLDL